MCEERIGAWDIAAGFAVGEIARVRRKSQVGLYRKEDEEAFERHGECHLRYASAGTRRRMLWESAVW